MTTPTPPDPTAVDSAMANLQTELTGYINAVAVVVAQAATDEAADQAQITALGLQLTAANATVTSQKATIDQLTAEVAQLETELAGAPTQPTFTTDIDINLVGVNGSTLAQQETQAVGKFGSSGRRGKFFDGGKGPQAAIDNLNGSGWGKAPGEVEPMLCFKRLNAADQSVLTNRAASLTADEYWVYWQEPEDDFGKGNLSTTDYQAAYRTLDAIRKAAPHPEYIKLAVCLNNYQENQVAGSTQWSTFLPPLKGIIDLVGLDDYDAAFDPATWTPATYLADGPAAAKALGCEWAVTEFGVEVSTKTPGDTPASAVARLMASVTWSKANGATSFNYWYAGAWVTVAGLDAALKSLAA